MHKDHRFTEADVWVWFLDVVDHEHTELTAILSKAECRRAARFATVQAAIRWTVARGRLRQILSLYVDASPQELNIEALKRGKPILAEPGGPHFSLSKSGDAALLVVCHDHPVGGDIERVADIEATEIAELYFTKPECAAIREATQEEVLERFYRHWTAKEALLKATGAGLSAPLDSFEISVATNGSTRLVWDSNDPQEVGRWTIASIAPAPGYLGAVAVRAPSLALNLRRWPQALDAPSTTIGACA